LRLNKGNVIDQVQLCCYVCLLQISTLSVQHILRRIERLKKTLLLPDF
jgi:hypothetical protein